MASPERDLDYENERHRRRMMLMRMQGETNLLERRMHWAWITAIVLGLIAFAGAMLT